MTGSASNPSGPTSGVPRTGLLELVPVPTLLYRLYRARATGILDLDSADIQHELRLEDGQVISVALGGEAVDPLGRILLELGKISDKEYQSSLTSMTTSNRRHGEILREMASSIRHSASAARSSRIWARHQTQILHMALFPNRTERYL